MHAAMIMDAAMMANAFPLMPQRHAAASAVLDLKDMRLLLPLVIRAAERRRVKAVRQSFAATQTAAWPRGPRAGVASCLNYAPDRR
jgi:hypothetical protein